MGSLHRILIAEDDLNLLDSVATVLESWPCEVIRATSGAEMLQRIARQGPFDLIITDVSMPWMSGLQVMLTARGAGHETPVLVITASSDSRIPRQVAALGPRVRVLRKPFDLTALEYEVTLLLAP